MPSLGGSGTWRPGGRACACRTPGLLWLRQTRVHDSLGYVWPLLGWSRRVREGGYPKCLFALGTASEKQPGATVRYELEMGTHSVGEVCRLGVWTWDVEVGVNKGCGFRDGLGYGLRMWTWKCRLRMDIGCGCGM